MDPKRHGITEHEADIENERRPADESPQYHFNVHRAYDLAMMHDCPHRDDLDHETDGESRHDMSVVVLLKVGQGCNFKEGLRE